MPLLYRSCGGVVLEILDVSSPDDFGRSSVALLRYARSDAVSSPLVMQQRGFRVSSSLSGRPLSHKFYEAIAVYDKKKISSAVRHRVCEDFCGTPKWFSIIAEKATPTQEAVASRRKSFPCG